MNPRALLLGAFVLAGTALCVALGFWQLARWREKRALNEDLRAAATTRPFQAGRSAPSLEDVRGRYVAVSGVYDERRQVLMGGGLRDEVPGVDLFTPLVLEDGSAILVERGWLPADQPDAVRLDALAEPGPRRVVGYPEAIPREGRPPPLVARPSGAATALWARRLDRDTLSARLGYAFAPYTLRQAPGPGVPPRPLRSWPPPYDEGTHLGYAVQWFAFAIILLGGSVWLALQRRVPRGGAAISQPSPAP